MATVPIEIVLQDVEVPVDPTPESGEETNIVVPNTGTISNDGDSNGGIGSAISIILPIVIAVLALGTMVALLIRRQQKRKSNTEAGISKKEKLATAASGTVAILAATVLVGNLVIPATRAATSIAPGTAELETEDKITIIATREQDSDTITATVKDTSYATANLDFGYKVTASMAEGLDSANLYLDGDETSEYYIAPVADGVLANNTWGYTLEEPSEDITYLSIPLEDTPATIVKGNNEIEDEPVDIYYTVQLGKEMPNGTYTGELEYTIAPAVEYMQDFATMTEAEKTATLTNMPEGEQYILKDIRDEKPYYISKLADGNVWMTQNLDLDLNKNTTLTPADTDISENWTPLRSTINFTGTTVDGWQDDNNTPYSANPGDVYYYTSGTNENDIQYNSLAECEVVHNDGTCQHYHAGNYYNWSAAVASNDISGMTTSYENAPDSVCPAGWRLPLGPNYEEEYYNDLSNLAISYPDTITGPIRGCGGGCLVYEYLPSGFNNVRTATLWYVRSGGVGVVGTAQAEASSVGYYWSSTVSDNYAYRLRFDSREVRPTDVYGRGQGYSVRCVSRQ